jgi:hypothetical protein
LPSPFSYSMSYVLKKEKNEIFINSYFYLIALIKFIS